MLQFMQPSFIAYTHFLIVLPAHLPLPTFPLPVESFVVELPNTTKSLLSSKSITEDDILLLYISFIGIPE